MACDVFISYSSVDKVFADAVCHKLESSNIRCWIAPRDIHPSEDWAEAIINAMENSRLLLLVFSSHSNKSPQVRREVERAVSKGLGILPFRIEDVPLSKSLEYFISAQHWLDAMTGDMEVHLRHLCDCVKALLEPLPHAPSDVRFSPSAPKPVLLATEPTPAVQAVVPGTDLQKLEGALAKYLGPIAKLLVKRAAVPNTSAIDLVASLAGEIKNEADKQQFLAFCKTL